MFKLQKAPGQKPLTPHVRTTLPEGTEHDKLHVDFENIHTIFKPCLNDGYIFPQREAASSSAPALRKNNASETVVDVKASLKYC
jgi:hypothetical protein